MTKKEVKILEHVVKNASPSGIGDFYKISASSMYLLKELLKNIKSGS